MLYMGEGVVPFMHFGRNLAITNEITIKVV